ncbi:MAG: DUF3237 family protein [Devosia sp.]
MLSLPEPRLLTFCRLAVEVGAPQIIGPGRFGERRVVPVLGGRVSGPSISGVVQPGADWQTISADGLVELDARYTFRTDDDAIVEIIDRGFRHERKDPAGNPIAPYMRSTVRFETGHPRYSWINRMIFVGTGGKQGTTVHIDVYSVE